MARFLLHKLTEKYGLWINFHPKLIKGDWNSSGGHVNFSTKKMRTEGGIDHIKKAMIDLEKTHHYDVLFYGVGND